jgi:hypothetical protein
MLHPAFSILFRMLKNETGNGCPEDEYLEHLSKFLQFVQKYLNYSEIVFIAESLLITWKRNIELTNQLDKIKILRTGVKV